MKRLARKKKRNMERRTRFRKKTRVQRINKYLWRTKSKKQKNKRKNNQTGSRNCKLETFCNWESSLEQSSSRNTGAREKITDQENMVNFLLQHSMVFEYLSRLLTKKNITGREK